MSEETKVKIITVYVTGIDTKDKVMDLEIDIASMFKNKVGVDLLEQASKQLAKEIEKS